MISPAFVTLAAPLVQTLSAAPGAAIRGIEGAFDAILLSQGNDGASQVETPVKPEAKGVEVADLQPRADALLSQFHERAAALLKQAGIPLDAPLVLERDSLGELHVAGGSPHAAWVERALRDDSELAALFGELNTVHRELSERRRSEEFERLFALDPTAIRTHLNPSNPLEEGALRVTITIERATASFT